MNESFPKVDVLIAYAGWEERFLLGLKRDFADYSPTQLLLFQSKQYEDWTELNRGLVRQLCLEKNVELIEETIDSTNPTGTWNNMQTLPRRMSKLSASQIVIDITTMPREAIWAALFFLRRIGLGVHYVYHSPEDYDGEWLSRDPMPPRLVFKHSGVLEFGKPTALFLITGFDIERTFEFINVFEPKIMIMGFQTGEQYQNDAQNVRRHMDRLQQHSKIPITSIGIDSYSPDHGEEIIKQCLAEYYQGMNVIASSLGPKPSALALYKVWEALPSIALAYAPSNQYNRNYSSGLRTTIRGLFSG